MNTAYAKQCGIVALVLLLSLASVLWYGVADTAEARENFFDTEFLSDSLFDVQVVGNQSIQEQSNHRPLAEESGIGPGCQSLLVNTGFENGAWTYARTLSEPGLVSSPTYSGQRAMRLGNALNGTNYQTHSTMHQTVTIPANATEVVLRFWEITGEVGDAGDYREVQILDTNYRLLRLLTRNRQYTYGQWTYHSFDIDDLRGQTVIVYFNVYNNGIHNSMRTYIDEASLTACGTSPMPTPTHTPTHTPTPIPPAGSQWYGEYWNNIHLEGSPHFTRHNSEINFDWGEGKPADSINADDFSVRWTRHIHFDQGNYRFQAQVDDGVRLYIDDQLVLDDWRIHSERTVSGDRYLSGGTHTLRLEYYERTERALIKLNWFTVTNPQDDPNPNGPWQGKYFNNVNLSGSPVLTRNDHAVHFDWGLNSPGSNVPADNFSVRWERKQFFEAGLYRFYARSDDGIRVWVGNQLRLDEWRDRSPQTNSFDVYLTAVNHDIRVEYYERTLGASVQFWNEKISDHPATSTPVPESGATPTPNGMILRTGSREERGQQSVLIPLELVSVPSGVNVGSVDVNVLYDSTILTVSTCTLNSHFDTRICNISEPGKIQLSAVSINGLTGDNTLAEFTFGIKQRADRSTTLRVEIDGLTDKDSNRLYPATQDGRVLFNTIRCNAGDVNCDSSMTSADSLFILQFSVGARNGTNNYPPASGQLYLPACDVSNDNSCTTVDALQVLQCTVSVANPLCPGAGGAVLSTMNSGAQAAAGIARVVASSATEDANGQLRVPITAQVAEGNLGALILQLGYDTEKIKVVDCISDPQEVFQGSQCNIAFGAGNKIRLAAIANEGLTGQVTLAELVVEPLGTLDEDVVLNVEVIEAANNLSLPMLLGQSASEYTYFPLIMR